MGGEGGEIGDIAPPSNIASGPLWNAVVCGGHKGKPSSS
jgi:hypothetical protein